MNQPTVLDYAIQLYNIYSKESKEYEDAKEYQWKVIKVLIQNKLAQYHTDESEEFLQDNKLALFLQLGGKPFTLQKIIINSVEQHGIDEGVIPY